MVLDTRKDLREVYQFSELVLLFFLLKSILPYRGSPLKFLKAKLFSTITMYYSKSLEVTLVFIIENLLNKS